MSKILSPDSKRELLSALASEFRPAKVIGFNPRIPSDDPNFHNFPFGLFICHRFITYFTKCIYNYYPDTLPNTLEERLTVLNRLIIKLPPKYQEEQKLFQNLDHRLINAYSFAPTFINVFHKSHRTVDYLALLYPYYTHSHTSDTLMRVRRKIMKYLAHIDSGEYLVIHVNPEYYIANPKGWISKESITPLTLREIILVPRGSTSPIVDFAVKELPMEWYQTCMTHHSVTIKPKKRNDSELILCRQFQLRGKIR